MSGLPALAINQIARLFGERKKTHTHTDTSKSVAHYFILPYHSHHNMTMLGLSLQNGNTESCKSLKQKFIFEQGTFYPYVINECILFH